MSIRHMAPCGDRHTQELQVSSSGSDTRSTMQDSSESDSTITTPELENVTILMLLWQIQSTIVLKLLTTAEPSVSDHVEATNLATPTAECLVLRCSHQRCPPDYY